MLTAVAEIAPSGWDDFVVRNSETPYPQTTLNARYTKACYGLTPIYCSAELADSRLQCLVFVNQARKILKWSCGPVLTGDSAQFGELTGLFIDWVSRQKCRIRTSTSVEICTLKSLLAANELLSHARQARMEDRLGALVKKDLTGDIWESAVYRSAGKKRKTKGLVDKSVRDGVVVLSAGTTEFPFDLEQAYLGSYRALMESGFARNNVDAQDSLAAARAIMTQDAEGSSKTFFAALAKEIVACLNFAIVGDEVYLRKLAHTGGSASSGATYQAMMAAAEWAKGSGKRWLNLTNIRLSADQKTRNIRQYKTRFGGVVYPVFELSSHQLLNG